MAGAVARTSSPILPSIRKRIREKRGFLKDNLPVALLSAVGTNTIMLPLRRKMFIVFAAQAQGEGLIVAVAKIDDTRPDKHPFLPQLIPHRDYSSISILMEEYLGGTE
jgi:hypothetical protein